MPMLTYTRHGREFTIDSDDLSSHDYLLQYGWSQSHQDVVAGVSGKVWDELAEKAMKAISMVAADKTKPFAEFTAYLKDPNNAEFAKTFETLHKQETVKTEIALLEKRSLAIIEDRVASRAGSPEEALAVEMRRIAMPYLSAWCKSKGFAVPKDKDVKRAALDKYIEENEEDLRPEAEANLARSAALAAKLKGKIPTPQA